MLSVRARAVNVAPHRSTESKKAPAEADLSIPFPVRTNRLMAPDLPALLRRQINAILVDRTQGTTKGYVRVRRISGSNSFPAHGVVKDGRAPGQRSGDGAYVPARR